MMSGRLFLAIGLYSAGIGAGENSESCPAGVADCEDMMKPICDIRTTQAAEYAQRGMTTAVADLTLGQPSPQLLPWEELSKASIENFEKADPLLMQYGNKQGYVAFRNSLAQFLSKSAGKTITGDEIIVTAGNSVALSLVCQALTDPGDTIAIESATYFLSMGIFADVGVKTVEVDMDEHGLDVSSLARRLEAGERINAIYTIPNFQNPSGALLPNERKDQLVELAKKYNFYIISDEPYNLLNYTMPKPSSMADHDGGSGRVVALGSWSKLMGPGLRLGWMQAHPSLVPKLMNLGVYNSGGGVNPIVSGMIHRGIDNGFVSRNIEKLKGVLGSRLARFSNGLRKYAPSLQFTTPGGGYFLWAKLPYGLTAMKFNEYAAVHKVAATPGPKCSPTGKHEDFIRMSFAFYSDDELEEAARRIGLALADAKKALSAKLRIALAQMPTTTDKNMNIDTARDYLERGSKLGAQVVILPEIWNGPYATTAFPKYAELMPAVGTTHIDGSNFGPSVAMMIEMAQRLKITIVGGTISERDDQGNIYNTALVIGTDGKILAKHRKAHLFDVDVPGKVTFRESDTLSAGSDVTTFTIPNWGVSGLGICYDLRFPEYTATARARGASLMLYPGAFNNFSGPLHWELLGRARAVDEQVFVALISPAKTRGAAYEAHGHSTVIDPWGKVIATTGEEPDIITADLELDLVHQFRSSIPVSKQKRNDLYRVQEAKK